MQDNNNKFLGYREAYFLWYIIEESLQVGTGKNPYPPCGLPLRNAGFRMEILLR